ncbi:MAG: DUF3494 domain-containing protein, partial [Bacteroidetes bacterium]|nr:DUF3494 domain-containing protein [Bacteroidota bacterium]
MNNKFMALYPEKIGTFVLRALLPAAGKFSLSLIFSLGIFPLLEGGAGGCKAQTLSANLQSFSILSGSSVTSVQTTDVNGNVGAVGTVDSTVKAGGTVTGSVCVLSTALDSLQKIQQAFFNKQAQTISQTNVSNTTYTAGTYSFPSSLTMQDQIILTGDSTAKFIFNINGSLTFDAQLVLSGSVRAENIFFNADSSVQILDSARICGTILCSGTISCMTDCFLKNARLLSADSVNMIAPADTLGIISKQLISFGSTCGCAIDLGNKDTCANNQITSDNELWLKFIPDSEQVEISVRDNNAQIGNDTLFIFKGNCNEYFFFSCIANHGNTSEFKSSFDSIPFTPGANYLLRLKTTLLNSSFSFCISNLSNKFHVSSAGPCSSNNCNSVNCSTSTCELIANGDFTNNFTPPSGQNPFYSCDVCCWKDGWGSPSINTINNPPPPPLSPSYAVLGTMIGVCNSNPAHISDAMYVPINVQSRNYILSYYDRVNCCDQNMMPESIDAFVGIGNLSVNAGIPSGQQCENIPANYQEIVGPTIGNNYVNNKTWTQKIFCFKVNYPYLDLFFFPRGGTSKTVYNWFVDGVSLIPFDPTFITNVTICSGSSVQLISSPCWQQLQALGVTASWTSTPAGFTSTSFTPTVSPQSPTVYTVTFKGPGGCTSNSGTTTVNVQGPTISFAADNGVHCLSSLNLVQFTSTIIGVSPFTIHWDFGDPASGPNNSSIILNPTHSYFSTSSGPGIYQIGLTVTDASGCSTTVCHPVEIAPCCYQKSDFDVQQDISLTTQTWQQPPFNGYCNSC